MLTNEQRIRLYEVIVIVLVIIAALFFYLDARSRLSDIRLINDVRRFGVALELFKRDQWRYPLVTSIDLRNDTFLSESGFAPGSHVYYRGRMSSGRPVLLRGTEEGYEVRFTLGTQWKNSGLGSRSCTLVTNTILSCNK